MLCTGLTMNWVMTQFLPSLPGMTADNYKLAQVRGAAEAQNKSWGAIITWTYNQPPYLEPSAQIYNDMVLAYNYGRNIHSHLRFITKLHKHNINVKVISAPCSSFWNYVQKNPGQTQQSQGKHCSCSSARLRIWISQPR